MLFKEAHPLVMALLVVLPVPLAFLGTLLVLDEPVLRQPTLIFSSPRVWRGLLGVSLIIAALCLGAKFVVEFLR